MKMHFPIMGIFRPYRTIFLIFILILSSVCIIPTADASFRDFPVPPFPKEVLDGDGSNDYNQYVEPWKPYLIYVGIVALVPLMVGMSLFCCSLGACCVRSCSQFLPIRTPPRTLSKKRVRHFSVVPYSFFYLIIILCTALSISAFLWFMVGWKGMRSTTFTASREGRVMPEKVGNSSHEIAGALPNIMDQFSVLVDNTTQFNGTISIIRGMVREIHSDVRGLMPHLDANCIAFKKVKLRQEHMVDLAFDGNLPEVSFSTFNAVFENSTQLISEEIFDEVEVVDEAINNGIAQLKDTVDKIRDHISSMNQTVSEQVETMIDQVDQLTSTSQEKINQYASEKKLDEYENYSFTAEVVYTVVICLVLSFTGIILTVGFLGVFVPFWPCIKCLSCFMLCLIPIYTVVATASILFYFVVDDICIQGESYLRESDMALSLPAFQVPPLPHTPTPNISIHYSDAILGILHCPENGNFLDSTGISLDAFHVPNLIESYEQKYEDALKNFNVEDFLSQSLDNLRSMQDSVHVAEDIDVQVTRLKELLADSIKTFFSSPPLWLKLSDFDTQEDQLAQLNSVLVSYGISPIEAADVIQLAPVIYKTSPPTPGMITTEPEKGDRFDATFLHVLDPVKKNLLWGSLAYHDMYMQVPVAPGSVEQGLIYNLSRMNAPSPVHTQLMYSNYVAMQAELSNLTESVYATQNYTKSIFHLEDNIDRLLTSVNQTYKATVDSVSQFIGASVDKMYQRVADTSALRCSFIGTFYTEIKEATCGPVRVSVGSFGIACILMAMAIFCMFCALLWADYVGSQRVSKKELEDGDGYSSDESEIVLSPK